jgi:hypothetical protein
MMPTRITIAAAVLLCGSTAARAKKPPLFEGVKGGSIVALDKSGKWKPLPDATVRFTCATTKIPSDENEWHEACDASLRIERDDRTVAKQSADLLGVDYAKVAGNHSTLKLDLMTVGEAALVVLRLSESEGDEWNRETVTEQLLAVDGSGLREVYRYEALRAYDPGPDGKEEEQERTTIELEVDTKLTRGVPNLIARRTAKGEDPDETVLVWDGRGYVDCADCRKPKSTALTSVLTPTLIDATTGKSIEPLLVKVLSGQRLDESDVKGISTASLGLLRNAPFARRGRPFKNPALQSFFYEPRSAASKLPALKPNPAFKETMLDAVDKANLAIVVAETRRRGK